MNVEPFPKLIPHALRIDAETEAYFERLHNVINDLRERTGGGVDLIESNNVHAVRPRSRTTSIDQLDGFYIGDGVPASAVGSNGNFYFRKDGTSDVIYHKQSGAWVAVA